MNKNYLETSTNAYTKYSIDYPSKLNDFVKI